MICNAFEFQQCNLIAFTMTCGVWAQRGRTALLVYHNVMLCCCIFRKIPPKKMGNCREKSPWMKHWVSTSTILRFLRISSIFMSSNFQLQNVWSVNWNLVNKHISCADAILCSILRNTSENYNRGTRCVYQIHIIAHLKIKSTTPSTHYIHTHARTPHLKLHFNNRTK